jgi:putative endopeptidase
VDSFRVTQEKVYYELIDIVKNYVKQNDTHRAIELNNVYKSFKRLDEKKAEQHVRKLVEKIDDLIKEGNLLKLLADVNKNEVVSWASPIVWSLVPDEKDSKIYRSTISGPQLSIYDYQIYIEDTADDQDTKHYKKEFKTRFFKFINTMFDECIGGGHGMKASDVWDVEYELMLALGSDSVKNDSPDYYNKVYADEALSKYGFNWNEFSKLVGYSKTPDFFICTGLSYLKDVIKLLNENDNWRSSKWRTYFIYIGVRQIMRFHKKWRYIYFDFWGKFIYGQQTIFPDDIYPIFGLSICFNTLLTNEYVDKNKDDKKIDYVQNMATDLLTVFKRIIHRNNWLSPKTKKYALLKLKHINLIIGSPKLLREDPLLNYSDNDPWENLYKIMRWRVRKQIDLEGEKSIDIPVIDWNSFKLVGTQAYVVNAYYTPTQNSIYVPLGYLQKPFIDLNERGIEYNLAHIGYTLAHEMSHSLDDSGSKYDYKGNLKNWWTEEDRRIFNRKVENVIKQYETFAGYDGIKMDASLSTGENLADISGLAICEEYLRDFQIKNNDAVAIRALSFEAFYVYIAIQARQKIYDKAIKAQLKTNPHPMDKYRTNCPLARLKLFQSLYNIKKGDKMFWSSTDTIW